MLRLENVFNNFGVASSDDLNSTMMTGQKSEAICVEIQNGGQSDGQRFNLNFT